MRKNRTNTNRLRTKTIAPVAFAFLCISTTAFSQEKEEQALKLLPTDERFKIGVLDNGLTYYIRENQNPEGKACFLLVNNIGAIEESKEQDGLAHFLEHMAFNGTKHFPGHGIDNYFKSIGITGGSHVNASTSQERTLYYLNDIPVKESSVVDSSLLILYDWTCNITLDPEEIDKERGVIKAEFTSSRTPDNRLREEEIKQVFRGTKYADHLILGTLEGLDSFKHQELVDFYNKWHRPEYQAIIVTGDIDSDEVEVAIKELFSKIEKSDNTYRRDREVLPTRNEDKATVLYDSENSKNSIKYTIKTGERREADKEKYESGYRFNILSDIAFRCLNLRLGSMRASSESSAIIHRNICSTTWAIQGFLTPREGKEAQSLELLLKELHNFFHHGVKSYELTLALQAVTSNTDDKMANDKRSTNMEIAISAVDHFVDGKALLSPSQRFEAHTSNITSINTTEIDNFIKSIKPEGAATIVATTNKENSITESELIEAHKRAAETNYTTILDKSKIIPGKITSESVDEIGNKVWMLSNGAKVILSKPSRIKEDFRITKLIPYGDISKVENGKTLLHAASTNLYLSNSDKGIAFATITSNDRIWASLSHDSEILMLHTHCHKYNKEALEHTLQTLHETHNISDVTPERLEYIHDNLFKEETRIDIPYPEMCYKKDDYHISDKEEEDGLKMLTAESLTQFTRDILTGDDGITYIVTGKYDIEDLRPLVEKYIASLPKGDAKHEMVSTMITFQKGNRRKYEPMVYSPFYTIVYGGDSDQHTLWSPRNEAITMLIEWIIRDKTRAGGDTLDELYNVNTEIILPINKYTPYTFQTRNFFQEKSKKELNILINRYRDILEEVAQGDFSSESLDEAKKSVILDYSIIIADASRHEKYLIKFIRTGMYELDAPEKMIESITKEEVATMLKRLLTNEKILINI